MNRDITDDQIVEDKSKKGFLSKYLTTVRLLLLLILEIIGLLILSQQLIAGEETLNPSGIMGTTPIHLTMMILSIVLFSTILFSFTKYVFIAQRKTLGLTNLFSYKAFLFFLVQLIFISLLFVVVDISLIGVFTLHGISLPSWFIVVTTPPDIFPSVPRGDDRLTYATFRAYYFFFFLSLLLIFPIVSMIAIVTRFGRERLKTVDPKSLFFSRSKILGNFYKFSSILILALGLFLTVYFIIGNPSNFIPMLILGAIMIGTAIFLLSALFFVADILRRIFHVGLTLGGYNLLILIPIIFLFYILPVVLWAFWDIYVILVLETTERTIFQHSGVVGLSPPSINPSDYSLAAPTTIINLLFLTLRFNLINPIRIYELDFIFIIGISAVVIGTVEGFSIISIISRLFRVSTFRRGVAISGTSQSFSLFYRLAQVLLMFSWIAIAWDRMSNVIDFLTVEFNFSISFTLDPVLETLFRFLQDLANPQLIEISFLFVIPLYIVFTSSLKFFSVSLVLERTKDDLALFMLIVSSAFVLIITKIYGDIIALPQFEGSNRLFLPFEILGGESILPFVIKIFRNIEGIAFYVGFTISVVYGLRLIWMKIGSKKGSN